MSKIKPPLILFSAIVAFLCGVLLLNSHVYLIGTAVLIVLIILALKSPLVFLISVVIIHEKGFQTIDFGIPHWMYMDIAFVALSIGLIVQLIKTKFHFREAIRSVYFRYIILIISVVFLSIFIGSWLIYNQPIKSLVFRARPFFLYFIFLYLVLIDFNIEQIKKFMGFVVYSACIISVLVIIDSKLLGGGKIFQLAMSNGISGFRAGMVRIFTYPFITVWAYFYLLSGIKLEKKKARKILYVIFLLIIGYQLVFCNITRQLIVVLLLTTILFLFNLKPFSKVIITSFAMALLILTAMFCINNTALMQDTFFYKIGKTTQLEVGQTTQGNIAIRRNAIKYFYPYFKKTSFLGMGMMSPIYENSPVAIGLSKGYNFADMGFFAILFRFGIFAIILMFLILKRVFIDLSCVQRRTKDHQVQIIVNSLIFLFISKIIILPFSTIFFRGDVSLFYGILFYFLFKLKKGLEKENAITNEINSNSLACM